MQRFQYQAVLCLAIVTLLYFPGALALPSDAETLSKLETQYYGRTYDKQNTEERLDRLENLLYGQGQTGDMSQRLSQLQSVLQQNLPQVTPSASTTPKQTVSPAPEPADATDYPTVTQLEKQLFRQSFQQTPIQERLARLEQQVFQKTFPNLPMVDRVDQLTLKLDPKGALAQEEVASSGNILPSSGEELAPRNFAVYSKISALEEQVFGRSFGGELLTNRLTRLEQQLLGRNQTGTIEDRLAQIQSRTSQTTQPNTSQVGPVQSYTPQVNSPYPGYVQTPVGAIGSMGNQQFSQEFMNMLPAPVQQRLRLNGTGSVAGMPNNGFSQQSTQVYTGPGTWTYQQETLTPYPQTPSWVQPYSGVQPTPQIQPNMVRPQALIQPVQPMNFPGGGLTPPHPFNQPPNPLVPIQPVVPNQTIHPSLAIIETQVYGRNFEGQSIYARLNQLEQQVFGQTAPQYTMPQRIDRLMRKTGALNQS